MFARWQRLGLDRARDLDIGFSLLGAGLTALAFSIGSFLLAPVAVPLAQRYGRLVLSAGGLLMAIGTSFPASSLRASGCPPDHPAR
jgi:MFS family permease